jgi:hypothetical protein
MVIPNIPGVPGLTRDPVSAFLELVISGRIGDPFNPGKALSQRGFARLVGINESTLRSAFRTEGRAPSARTLARLDAALRQVPQSLFQTRREGRGVVTDTLTPLGRRYVRFTAPVGARSFRVVVETGDPNYPYATMTPTADQSISPEAFFDDLEGSGMVPTRVIWDVS